jgi:hypothetical protein
VPPTGLLARLRRRPVLRLAKRYLGGLQGIEIGGSSQNDFGIDVINVDCYGEGDEHYRSYKQAEIDAGGTAGRWTWSPPATSCRSTASRDRDRPLTPLDELIERHRSGFESDEDKQVIETRDPDTRGETGFS